MMSRILFASILTMGSANLCMPVAFADVQEGRSRAVFNRALDYFDQAQQVQAEQPDLARHLFRSAAQHMRSIASAGITNGWLEYNLGNCYLQAGDVGEAILHYRRAQRLIPRNGLLADNLAEARSRRLLSIPHAQRSAFLRSVFFWHYDTSLSERAHAAIFLYFAFWALLSFRGFVQRTSLTVTSALALLVAGVLAGSVAVEHLQASRAPAGVITAMDVTVYKGPGSGYQRQFEQPLQPGVEFNVIEKRPGWWNIRLPDLKTGWIDSASGELVDTPPLRAKLAADSIDLARDGPEQSL